MFNKDLTFYSLLDFYPNKEKIKSSFDILTIDEKIIYKMYVYSLPWTNDDVKDLIWSYLNGYTGSIFELGKKYRIKKQQNDKRQKIYDREKENEIQYNA